MIVLDTNILSELMRPQPAPQVMRWLSAQPHPELFTTAVTEGEILYGIALLMPGRRRTSLEAAARAMFAEDFANRVLTFDSAAACEFADIAATRRRSGRPISHADAEIAAIARSRGAAVATRTVTDFDDCAIKVIDPGRI